MLCSGLQPHFSDILLAMFYSVSWLCKVVTSNCVIAHIQEKESATSEDTKQNYEVSLWWLPLNQSQWPRAIICYGYLRSLSFISRKMPEQNILARGIRMSSLVRPMAIGPGCISTSSSELCMHYRFSGPTLDQFVILLKSPSNWNVHQS